MLSHLSDEELVTAYQQNSSMADEAYNELINRYYMYVIQSSRSTLYRHSNARIFQEGLDTLARDIAHDFMVEQMPRVLSAYIPQKSSLKTWINRCVSNFTISALRRRENVQSFEVEDEEWKSFYIIKDVLGEDLHDRVHDLRDIQAVIVKYVEALPDHYRRPIELRFWHEMSIEEIAKALRLPVGTIKSQLSRAITLLRQRLSAEGLDQELR
ncbi:MAG: sigma-70 family RNA polymerase sigma factor [Bacteroidia bacterium]|jgi:RNA polymerase sigma-70 factor (ECF subfamily)|nr:sigma-70 family RNA polymerase sigma factor [Bacteroidia bacterium]GIV24216.1 MAG: hypothetical protein KatS3mg025_1875 [Bacteroidia bacterium]